jgi:hypothetical protein
MLGKKRSYENTYDVDYYDCAFSDTIWDHDVAILFLIFH